MTLTSITTNLILLIALLCMPAIAWPDKTASIPGPKYDLIFAVNTFDPDLETTISIAPYVYEDIVYIEFSKIPPSHGTSSSWVKFYRYHSQTGVAEEIVSADAREMETEMANSSDKETYTLHATKSLKLDTNNTSPDGFSLAAPRWVTADPVTNAFGSLALFRMTGHFGNWKVQEKAPRLEKGGISLSMKSKKPIINNEADNAFLLGWVLPDKGGKYP